MKRMNALFSALLFLVLLATSCSRKKKDVAAGYIPANASAVMAISGEQLMNKLSKEGVNYQKIYNMIFGGLADTTSTPGVFWQGAAQSGINFKEPIYVSLTIPSKITDNDAILRFILPLSDAKQFEKSIKGQDAEIKKEGDITYAVLDESAFGHNGKHAIYVAHLNAETITGVKVSGVFNNPDSAGSSEQEPFSAKKAMALIKESFNLEKKNSLAGNDWFGDMPLDKNDMKLWLNYTNGIAGMLKGDASTAALVLEPLLKNSFIASVMNFETGKITGSSRMYFREEAAAAIKKSPPREIDLSLVQHFPGTQLNGFMGFSLDPSTIRNILEFVKWDGAANVALMSAGLTMDDLSDCLTGDISLVFSDAQATQLSVASPTSTLRRANWAAVAKLNNKIVFDKIMGSPKVQEKIKKDGELYLWRQDNDTLYLMLKDKLLYLGANKALLTQFMSGTAKNNFAGTLSRFSKKPMGMYISTGNSGNTATGVEGLVQIFAGAVKEIVLTGNRFEKNYMQSELELATTNASQNSLAGVFNAAFAYMQAQMQAMMKEAAEEGDMPRLEPMKVD
ncbi:MAG: DUF4836 family protein [Dinghuibacter sp.]|nr:DUF4836 family protein [Dinghuibacter sp.]